jgi:apolipoprotein N-acyltransferase
VAVAQPDVVLHDPITPQDQQDCLREYPRYTDMLMARPETGRPGRPVGAGRPQLVVWPETAFPTALNLDPAFAQAARQTARRNHIWLLMGALDVESPPGATVVDFAHARVYNTAWLFDDQGGLVGTYSKMDLVPFGEYVPFRKELPLVNRYPVREFDFTPGTKRNLLSVRTRSCGALICFEAIFPRQSQTMVNNGAEFLAFLTSDAWAGPSAEVLLHSQTAPLRAVETGRWVVRAATVGESGIISPRGQWVASVPPWHAGTAQGTIATLTGRTPYGRWGDWPLVGLALVLVLGGCGGETLDFRPKTLDSEGRGAAGELPSESEV